jgi:hypothetical protein
MKFRSSLVLLISLVFSIPGAYADDDLKPEPFDQAVLKFNELQNTNDVDPMNHEVWKLYVLYDLTPSSGFDKTPKWIVTALMPGKKYRILLPINQLYNFLRPSPKSGDVIVVDGRVTNHFTMTVDFDYKRVRVPVLQMYLDGAVMLKEKFDPNASKKSADPNSAGPVPTPTPGGPRMGVVYSAPTPTPGGRR